MTRFHVLSISLAFRLPGTGLILGTPRAGWQQRLAATKLLLFRIGVFVFLVAQRLRLCEACRSHRALCQHRQRGRPTELQGGTNRHGVSVGATQSTETSLQRTLRTVRLHVSHTCPGMHRGKRASHIGVRRFSAGGVF